ncbi:hypothetical protein P8452_16321 [Trifolium repens]|nr:hypothetical protein P8452_16321 [Trifolium repens]
MGLLQTKRISLLLVLFLSCHCKIERRIDRWVKMEDGSSSKQEDFVIVGEHAVRPLLDPLSKLGFQEPSCAHDSDNVISIFYLLLLPLLEHPFFPGRLIARGS